ncbi:MAG: hypothetical protein JW882_01275, partial [Deltaproteobacteria bacterium]|nr:hypothetical protein [Deltaproteobacteria bacterium]
MGSYFRQKNEYVFPTQGKYCRNHRCQAYTVDKHEPVIYKYGEKIGVHFGIGVSGVFQSGRRVAMQIRNDKRLKKKVDKLILDLGLST